MELTLRNLRYVLALAENAHFGRAADALGISQPALSRGIRAIERELGVVLFERRNRGGIEPTVFGRLLIEKGETLLVGSEDLLREVDLLKGLETGELSVRCGLYPAELSVARAIGGLVADHPRWRCRIGIANWRDATEAVLQRKADIAVAETSHAERNRLLRVEPLASHPLIYFCRPRHPLLSVETLRIEDVVGFPWISTLCPKRIRDFLPDPIGAAGWIDEENGDLVPAVHVDDLTSAKQAVMASDGVGAAPLPLLADDFAAGRLCAVPLRPRWLHLNYGFIYLRDRTLSPATKAFIAAVKRIERTLMR
jgi:DNA-binding transcriptional LysR family regulator